MQESQNIPSDISYDITKLYQVQSDYRRTESPFKHLGWSAFTQTVNTFKSLGGCSENSVLDVWRGFEYAYAAKQGK